MEKQERKICALTEWKYLSPAPHENKEFFMQENCLHEEITTGKNDAAMRCSLPEELDTVY